MKKIIVVLLTLVSLLLLTTVSALAVPPERGAGTFDYVEELIHCADHGEWNFVIMNHVVGNYNYKLFFNQDGDVIREKYDLRATNTLYNQYNPEKVATGEALLNWRFYFDEDETFEDIQGSGVWWKFKVHSDGFSWRVMGMREYDENWNPIIHHGLYDEDLAEICVYFAEP